MSDKDLSNFLKKIEQLNQIAELIKNNPNKKLSLSKCKNHDEVIKLSTEWGFDISKRWGEYLLILFFYDTLKQKYNLYN